MKLVDIDFSRILLPEVKAVIENQISHGAVMFSDLEHTAPTPESIEKFGVVKDRFVIHHPVQKVFDHYISLNPAEVWKRGSLIGYELSLDKNTGEVFYNDDEYPGAKLGQVLYMHSNIWGLYILCMSQEIIKIDTQNHTIYFSYTKWGLTEGTQSMQFNKISDTETELIHTSLFKGESSFRDKFYPFFHSMVMKKFHRNAMGLLKPSS